MFKRVITTLSRSPSSAEKLPRYIKRKTAEQKVRGAGLLMLVLSFAVLFMSGVTSNTPSVVASPANDIVVGGIADGTSGLSGQSREDKIKANAIQALRTSQITKNVYNYYNITEADIQNTTLTTISTGDPNFKSVGRQNFGVVTKTNESGGTTFYERTINSAYRNKTVKVEVLQGRRANPGQDGYGTSFSIITSCGNPVLNPDETLKPDLELKKTSDPASGTNVQPGDEINYTVSYRNVGDAPAINFKVSDVIPQGTTFVKLGEKADNIISQGNGTLVWSHPGADNSMGNGGLWHSVGFTVRVNDDAKDGQEICNTATMDATGDSTTSNKVCNIVKIPPPPPPPPPKPVVKPVTITCSALEAVINNGRLDGAFRITGTNPAKEDGLYVEVTPLVNGDTINDESGQKVVKRLDLGTEDSFQIDGDYYVAGLNPGTYKTEIQITTNAEDFTVTNDCSKTVTVASPTCDDKDLTEQEKEDLDCPKPIISLYKTAQNITAADKPITNPSTTDPISADGGDKILYTITYVNNGNASAIDIVPTENGVPGEDDISDVLEHSDLIDAGDASKTTSDGLTKLSWANQKFTLRPGEKKEFKFTVQVKEQDNGCNTPTPTNEGGSPNVRSYDCVMENKFGTSDTFVNLKKGASKAVQSATTKIPDTGAGTLVIFAAVVLGISAFSYYRTRLIKRELSYAYKLHRGGQ